MRVICLPKAVFIDGTHIKGKREHEKKQIRADPAAAKHYAKVMEEEVNADKRTERSPLMMTTIAPASLRSAKTTPLRRSWPAGRSRAFVP